MICCACDRPADWQVQYARNKVYCTQNFCSLHSMMLWREMKPLSNPEISFWQQERLFDVPVQYRSAA